MSDCPCGSGLAYEVCCGPIVEGTHPAPTAEALMALALFGVREHVFAHLERSLSSAQRKDYSAEEAKRWPRTLNGWA